MDGRQVGLMTIFRTIGDDRECANPQNRLETIKRLQTHLGNRTRRFLKASESDISKHGDGYDGSLSRQIASSLGGNVGFGRELEKERKDLQAMIIRPPLRQIVKLSPFK
jgi:hypothetical protein